MVPNWLQWIGALGTIAIAGLALVTLLYSERFRNWAKRLRNPIPVLVEAWVERQTGPLAFILHLGFTNPGEAPIFITRVAAKLSVYPFELSLPSEYLRVDDQALIKPFDGSSLEFDLQQDDSDFLELAIDYLKPEARGFAIECVSGDKTRVLSWELPKIEDAAYTCNANKIELLPLAGAVSTERLAWLPWRG